MEGQISMIPVLSPRPCYALRERTIVVMPQVLTVLMSCPLGSESRTS